MNEMLKGLAAINWTEFESKMVEEHDALTSLPDEVVVLLRKCYEAGHKDGQTATYDVLKDVYDNDVDEFVEIFEGE